MFEGRPPSFLEERIVSFLEERISTSIGEKKLLLITRQDETGSTVTHLHSFSSFLQGMKRRRDLMTMEMTSQFELNLMVLRQS